MRRIVVGVDGSEGSQRALDWACTEAGFRHASVDVVTAWEPPFVAEFGAVPPAATGTLPSVHEDAARALLDRMAAARHLELGAQGEREEDGEEDGEAEEGAMHGGTPSHQ
jgi:nucleotide-binding universal stress UspA family protein